MDGGEVVARVRLKRHHATRHASVYRFVVEQRQHGLVASVDAVEIADGQGAAWAWLARQTAQSSENLHGR